MPRRSGARVPVEQEHRRPVTAVTHMQHGLVDVDVVDLESLEHGGPAITRARAKHG